MVVLPDDKDIYHWIPVRKVLLEDGQTVLVSEWEGSEIENIGLLKEDLLGITQLDIIGQTVRLIKEETGEQVDVYNLPLNDREVFRYFRNGWNSNIFHFGSSGLTVYCKQLQPENMEDLIAAISLYRPGTMEINFHNEYVLRKQGKRKVEHLWRCENVTEKTYGLIVYQEQVMRICQELAGFSLVEADDVRKAMGKKILAVLLKYKEKFIERAVANGGEEETVSAIWDMLEKFASYSFNNKGVSKPSSENSETVSDKSLNTLIAYYRHDRT
jgi:DNA polymerase-3 subunit alpha